MIDLAVQNCGMVTSVGLSAPASCAAIRCGLANFQQTRFMDGYGQWITAAEVPLENPWRGRAKLVHMAAEAVQETISDLSEGDIRETILLLCLAEESRPGRIPGLDQNLLREVQKVIGRQFHSQSMVLANGRVGGGQAIEIAMSAISSGQCRYGLVVGTDTFLVATTLAAYEKENRILTEHNSDGFIPGEAGAAVLLAPVRRAKSASIIITGCGFGLEKAHIRSEEPLRGDGMAEAIKNALSMSGKELGDLSYRICDISGEQYYFKEAALALLRVLRKRKEAFDIWHPAECIGETGAAIVPVVLAVASAAVNKGYSKGRGILCHFANDDGQRAAIIVNASDAERIA